MKKISIVLALTSIVGLIASIIHGSGFLIFIWVVVFLMAAIGYISSAKKIPVALEIVWATVAGFAMLFVLIFVVSMFPDNDSSDNVKTASVAPDTSHSGPEVTDTAGIIEGLNKVIKRLPTEKFPKNDVYEIQAEIAYFQIIGRQINMAETSIGNKGKKEINKLKKTLVSVQVKEFPIIRQAYATALANKMWEHDMRIGLSGKRNTTLELTAGIFAANKNIVDFNGTLLDMLKLLRFKETQYRWYRDADEFEYYTIPSLKDSEITIAE